MQPPDRPIYLVDHSPVLILIKIELGNQFVNIRRVLNDSPHTMSRLSKIDENKSPISCHLYHLLIVKWQINFYL